MNESKKAALFRELIDRCPLCNKPIKKHRIFTLSSVILTTENYEKVVYLEELIINRQWSEAAEVKEGCQTSDIKKYYILNCPEKGMALLEFIYTYELWSDDWMDSAILLLPEDYEKLDKIVNSAWLVL